VTNVPDAKALRDRAKQLAEERRTERKNRKRKCSLCGTEESEKTPFVAHPDGIATLEQRWPHAMRFIENRTTKLALAQVRKYILERK